MSEILYLIPARKGSKGIPGKNLRTIAGKPLAMHSIDVARKFVGDDDICLSTDDEALIGAVTQWNYEVPFIRPQHLATDTTSMHEVLINALDFYAGRGKHYQTLVLLQPTSPFRTSDDVAQALKLFHNDLDMVASVKLAEANPYYVLFEEDSNGYLQKSKQGNFVTRQECPKVWQLNGAVYIINTASLRLKGLGKFDKILKSEMTTLASLDLDTELDWKLAMLINEEYHLLPHK
ncbi:acylneuraminate cytidylyltransferase family protein [Lentimicrobium sp.]